MNRLFSVTVTLSVVAMLMLLGSCDKIGAATKNIPGKVAGMVTDEHGVGRGYISVKLLPAGNDAFETYQTTTEESGFYHHELVMPGRYRVEVVDAAEVPYPSDVEEINVGPGRTVTVDIRITAARSE